MGHQLSKVIQYFFSILFPILACIIGGLANLEFSYHYYIQFNPYQPIKWEKPQNGWIKMNIDGFAIENLEIAGCGGVLRDE